MMAGVQIIGVLFGLIMIYMSYYYYKRNSYTWRSFLVWLAVWVALIAIIIAPTTIYGVMQALEIERTADFFVMAGFVLFALIIFYLYVTVKQTNKKVEKLVRTIAFRKAEKKTKKKK